MREKLFLGNSNKNILFPVDESKAFNEVIQK